VNETARKAWELVQSHSPLTTPEIEALRVVVEGAGVRLEPKTRLECRHGMSLKAECSTCAETPEVARTWFPSDELAGIPLGTAVEERRRAEMWMDTAAQHARGEGYFKTERDKLIRYIQIVANSIVGVGADMQKVWETNRMLVDNAPRVAPAENTDSGTLDIVIPVEPT